MIDIGNCKTNFYFDDHSLFRVKTIQANKHGSAK